MLSEGGIFKRKTPEVTSVVCKYSGCFFYWSWRQT